MRFKYQDESFATSTTLRSHQFIPNRPLVLLAGWLGCKPRHLTFYAKIYASIGYNVMVRIAPPASIVLASMTTTKNAQYGVRDQAKNIILGKDLITMEDIARETINEITNTQCASLVVHVFSNGGAFLWEAMRRILYPVVAPSLSSSVIENQQHHYGTNKSESSKLAPVATQGLSALTGEVRNRIIGIIFDSSPADYSMRSDLLSSALQYSSSGERIRIKLYLIVQNTINIIAGEKHANLNYRAAEFWSEMQNFAAISPELYIYSNVDALTPSDSLKELIKVRRQNFGKDLVQSLELDSTHCRHGFYYPDEYCHAVKSFLDHLYCLGRCDSSRKSAVIRCDTIDSITKREKGHFLRSLL